jgi:hypothetical protein
MNRPARKGSYNEEFEASTDVTVPSLWKQEDLALGN